MTTLSERIVDAVSRLLDDRDREAVLGDLAESDQTPWQTVCGILSLFFHREAKQWPSWAVAVLLSLPGSLLLAGYSLTVSQAYGRAFADATGLTVGPGLFLFLCNLAILAAWRWTGGLIPGSLSRRTAWISTALAFLPCAFCITWFDLESLSRLSLLLILFLAIWHAARGESIAQMRLRPAVLFATGVTVLTIPTWYSHGSWLPNWILSWPAWYLVGTAQRVENYAGE